MPKRERTAALAGAILLTVALPIAIDQGYFRYNAWALPLLGLSAAVLYAWFFFTSNLFIRLWRGRRKIAITISILIVAGIAIGWHTGSTKSKEHVAELRKQDTHKEPEPIPGPIGQVKQIPANPEETVTLGRSPNPKPSVPAAAKALGKTTAPQNPGLALPEASVHFIGFSVDSPASNTGSIPSFQPHMAYQISGGTVYHIHNLSTGFAITTDIEFPRMTSKFYRVFAKMAEGDNPEVPEMEAGQTFSLSPQVGYSYIGAIKRMFAIIYAHIAWSDRSGTSGEVTQCFTTLVHNVSIDSRTQWGICQVLPQGDVALGDTQNRPVGVTSKPAS